MLMMLAVVDSVGHFQFGVWYLCLLWVVCSRLAWISVACCYCLVC